jgi:chemotaxis protein methyltransferase CheR
MGVEIYSGTYRQGPLAGSGVRWAPEREENDMDSRTDRSEAREMSHKDYTRLSSFIYKECGIKLAEGKKLMLEARLHKRLKALNLLSYSDYCDYLFSPAGLKDELSRMIDLVTTNKTDFYREPDHFEYLRSAASPELLSMDGAGVRKNLSIWSCACSSGEEPYTLAMVVSEFAEAYEGYRFSILATDISTRVLEKGREAVYDEERVLPLPMALKKRYLLRSKDKAKGLVRISSHLRRLVEFRRLNLMDESYGIKGLMHVIFCRNIIIYFDRRTQEDLLKKLCYCLTPGGFLFMGHSENLHGMDLPLSVVAPAAYRKNG